MLSGQSAIEFYRSILTLLCSFDAEEPTYTPIETVGEVAPAAKPRPAERSTNSYQTILEKASG
jgi:hypothetical protein